MVVTHPITSPLTARLKQLDYNLSFFPIDEGFIPRFLIAFKVTLKVFLSYCQAKKTTISTKVLLNFPHNSFLPLWQVSQWAEFWLVSHLCDSCLLSFRKAHFASRPETIEHGFLSLLLLGVGLRLQEQEGNSRLATSCFSSSPFFFFVSFFFFFSSSSCFPSLSPPLWWLREMCLALLPLPECKPRFDENGVKSTEDSFTRIWLHCGLKLCQMYQVR